jgi:hypothetical protein
MILRLKGKKAGGHVDVTVSLGTQEEGTFAVAGTIVVREEEWEALRAGGYTIDVISGEGL